MCNTNKSETKTKKDIDEWLDGEGRFHRKVVIETITSPIDTRQATNPRMVSPGFFRQSPCFPEFRFSGSQGYQEPKQFFGRNMSDKPVIDVKEFIEKGKKILSGMGIDVEKEIKNLFTQPEKETKTAEELVNETKEAEIKEEPKQEVKEETKTKPLNQKKEVEKWQKTKKPKIQKQNQTQKIPKIQKILKSQKMQKIPKMKKMK